MNFEAGRLFLGDAGELPLETRRALVQLLVGPALEARRHSKLWPTLLQEEAVIRARLADLFLDLVLDTEAEVAFIRQADTGELEVPRLLRRAALTFLDSVLLLFLRQLLTRAQTRGERAAVSVAEIQEHLSLYERSMSTDHAGFSKRVQASIEKVKHHNILRKIRGSEERYEISPTLKLLFSAEEIRGLLEHYRRIESGTADKPLVVADDDLDNSEAQTDLDGTAEDLQ